MHALVDIVKPVDDIKETEGEGEYYPWPSVDGVHIGQVGDFDFELTGTSPQPRFLQVCVPVQAEASGLSRRARLPVLEARVVERGGRRVVDLAQRGGDFVCPHLVVDLQGRQQNVPLGVGLAGETGARLKNGLRWLIAHVRRARGCFRTGWRIAAVGGERGLHNRVCCLKLKSLHTNHLQIVVENWQLPHTSISITHIRAMSMYTVI